MQTAGWRPKLASQAGPAPQGAVRHRPAAPQTPCVARASPAQLHTAGSRPTPSSQPLDAAGRQSTRRPRCHSSSAAAASMALRSHQPCSHAGAPAAVWSSSHCCGYKYDKSAHQLGWAQRRNRAHRPRSASPDLNTPSPPPIPPPAWSLSQGVHIIKCAEGDCTGSHRQDPHSRRCGRAGASAPQRTPAA